MFLNRKTQYWQDINLPNLIYRLITIPIKILASYYMDMDKIDSKINIEQQKTQNSQLNTDKENKPVGDRPHPILKLTAKLEYYIGERIDK